MYQNNSGRNQMSPTLIKLVTFFTTTIYEKITFLKKVVENLVMSEKSCTFVV